MRERGAVQEEGFGMVSVDEFRADALGHPGGMMIADRVLEGVDFSGLRIDYFSIYNSTRLIHRV